MVSLNKSLLNCSTRLVCTSSQKLWMLLKQNTMSNPQTPGLRPVPLKLFPTKDTLQEAIDYAQSIIPPEQWNQMSVALMVYHNTLLKVVNEYQ